MVLLSLIGLRPSQSTTDHFRTNVYRPRLSLLLLVILLSPYNTSQLADSGSALSTPAAASSNWAVSVIDGMILASPLPTRAAVSLSLPTPAPTAAAAAVAVPRAASVSQPPPGSLFRLPKPSWRLILDPHVLPALLPLHALWALRFVGMALEDHMVASSLVRQRPSLLVPPLLLQICVLTLLTLAAASPAFFSLVTTWCDPPQQPYTLPIRTFVYLETVAVLASLWSSVVKIEHPALEFLPATLCIPSPSHSPSVLQLLPLPLPPLLVALITGQRPDPVPSRRPRAADDGQQQTYRVDGEVQHSTSVRHPVAPLRLRLRRKPPRLRNQTVRVSTPWLADTLVSLLDRLVGSVLYAVATLHLPTLSPTSLPPVLALLSLRAQLAALTHVWARARGSVECLEFVRRRWAAHKPRSKPTTPDPASLCPICFEPTHTPTTTTTTATALCTLDCGHQIHDTCLVAWLTAQAFCPTCHAVMSFTPPTTPPSASASASTSTSAAATATATVPSL